MPIAVAASFCLSILAACGEEKHSYVPNASDGEHTPTMLTFNVNTFISDSGYTRYHITAPLWGMYEDAAEPFWRFPEGLYMEQYDRDLKPNSDIRCDSALYLSQKRIWRLDGNVVMVNVDGDSFLTQQLFWDQVNRQVSSDSFIHIVRSDRIIEGYGFTSNETMTSYTVNKPTGIFPAKRREQESKATEEPDSVDTRRRPPGRNRLRPMPDDTVSQQLAPTDLRQLSPSPLFN